MLPNLPNLVLLLFTAKRFVFRFGLFFWNYKRRCERNLETRIIRRYKSESIIFKFREGLSFSEGLNMVVFVLASQIYSRWIKTFITITINLIALCSIMLLVSAAFQMVSYF